MGTLGCINNMMRRDKENRELRKAGKERLNETRNRLIDLNKKGHSSHLSLEQLEEIRIKTQEKEEAETHQLFKIKLIMLGIVLIAGVLIWIGITFQIPLSIFLSYSLKKPIRILIFVIPTWNNLKNR